MKLRKVLLVVLILTIAVCGFAKRQLVINSNTGDPEPKRVLNLIVEKFKVAHPDIEVTLNIFAHEDFKILLRTWLPSSNAPDVVTWFAGERMRYFAEKGLLYPLNEVFEGSFEDIFPSAFRSACSFEDEVYFIPDSWYWWAVYFRKSTFAENGIMPPTTWEEFLEVCEAFKAKGITPITIGTKYSWTTGAWFDYLNMRVNGLDWYIPVLDGKVPYTDPKIKKVFDYWQVLVDNEYFLENHSSLSWQEGLNPLITKEAGMYLMGQFLKDSTPKEIHDDIDFFRFPVIDANIPLYEETPIDGWMMPANGKNKAEAIEWLKFVASEEIQTFAAKELGRLAANKFVAPPNAHAKKGLTMIMHSAGVMGFYDRDTDPEMAEKGMNGFVEFMIYPEHINEILKNLEADRIRIFGK
jgi:multiple sugar transport system substrate-binding protein